MTLNDGPRTVTIGDRVITVERPTGLKASRALGELRAITKAVPDVSKAIGDYRREYEAANVVELDRAQARMQYPPRAILDADGQPVRNANGDIVFQASPLDGITDTDWQESGGRLKFPASPSFGETVAAVFPVALEDAEQHVYRLLAVFATPNHQLTEWRKQGDINDRLEAAAGDLLDQAYADQLLELAVVAAEVVDHHFTRKTRELGDRVGNLRRLVGMGSTTRTTTTAATSNPANGASDSSPTLSTDSPANTTDGPPTSSSTNPTNTSSSSGIESTGIGEQNTQHTPEMATVTA